MALDSNSIALAFMSGYMAGARTKHPFKEFISTLQTHLDSDDLLGSLNTQPHYFGRCVGCVLADLQTAECELLKSDAGSKAVNMVQVAFTSIHNLGHKKNELFTAVNNVILVHAKKSDPSLNKRLGEIRDIIS